MLRSDFPALLAYLYAAACQRAHRKVARRKAEIREANRLYLQGGKKIPGAADQERRLQRLQEILDELISLTDWKKP
jgi:hypothetical protein